VKTNRGRSWSRVIKHESSGIGAGLIKTKGSTAGAGAMFMKRKSSGARAVSFLWRSAALLCIVAQCCMVLCVIAYCYISGGRQNMSRHLPPGQLPLKAYWVLCVYCH